VNLDCDVLTGEALQLSQPFDASPDGISRLVQSVTSNLPKTLKNSYLKSLPLPDNNVLIIDGIAYLNAAGVRAAGSQTVSLFWQINIWMKG
jgi:hypothetical protein